jgi:hypothetical protein
MASSFRARFQRKFSPLLLELPGLDRRFDIEGELAWESKHAQAGVRFKTISEEQLKRFASGWAATA